MSIHIILGKPGSGKSRYATGDLIKQLRETDRNIVTNLPLKLGRLNEYLQKRYPKEDLRMLQRVRIMTDDEMREFWKIRGHKEALTSYPEDLPSFDQWVKPFPFTQGMVIDDELLHKILSHRESQATLYSEELKSRDAEQREWIKNFGRHEGQKGVAYFLDEAHIAFNARDWAVLGRGALHYMSQHRKLGDLVFPITQALGNLDKQFRSVAEDYTVLRNEAVMKMGPFRGAERFKFRRYYDEPSRNSEPYETGTFLLDKDGVASCYDTAKGIGVHGTMADIGRRAKGISIYWVFPIVALIAAACAFVPFGLGKIASGFVTGGKVKETVQEKANEVKQAEKPSTSIPERAESRPMPAPKGASGGQARLDDAGEGKPQGEEIRVLGYVHDNSRITVLLEGGDKVTEEDGRIEAVGRGRIKIDGKWHTVKPAAEGGNFYNNFYKEKNTVGTQNNIENKARNVEVIPQTVGHESYDGVTQPQPKPQNEKQ